MATFATTPTLPFRAALPVLPIPLTLPEPDETPPRAKASPDASAENGPAEERSDGTLAPGDGAPRSSARAHGLPVWRALPRHLGTPELGPRTYDPRTQGLFVWDPHALDADANSEAGAVVSRHGPPPGYSRQTFGPILAESADASSRFPMTRRLVVLLVLLGLAVPAAAALLWPETLRRAPTVQPDSVAAAAFGSARFEGIRSAWATLSTTPHTRRARTEQHTRDGLLRAFAEHETVGARTLRTETSGAFDYGLFTAYISDRTTTPDPHNVGALALSNLSEVLRSRDAYRFAIRSDTVVAEQPVQIVEATARAGAGDGRNVRRFTLFVDAATQTVVGVDVQRIDLAMWFREETRTRVVTKTLPDGRTMPSRTDFESLVIMPFSPTLPISTTAIYTPLAARR